MPASTSPTRASVSRFTTRNQHRYPEQIRLELVDGPFRSLTGHWDFLPLRAGACKVQLTLQYEFVSGLLGRAVARSSMPSPTRWWIRLRCAPSSCMARLKCASRWSAARRAART